MSLAEIKEIVKMMHEELVLELEIDGLKISIGHFKGQELPKPTKDAVAEAVKNINAQEDAFFNEMLETKAKLGE